MKPMTLAEFEAWIKSDFLTTAPIGRIREALRQREELVEWEARWRALSKGQDEALSALSEKCEAILLRHEELKVECDQRATELDRLRGLVRDLRESLYESFPKPFSKEQIVGLKRKWDANTERMLKGYSNA